MAGKPGERRLQILQTLAAMLDALTVARVSSKMMPICPG